MKFYSYDYVLSQISQQNWTMIIVSTFLVIVTGFFAFKAFKDKRGSKFRELSLISILTLIAFVLIMSILQLLLMELLLRLATIFIVPLAGLTKIAIC